MGDMVNSTIAATANDGAAASLRFDVGFRLPRHDVAYEAVDVRLGDVFYTTDAK